MAYTDTDAAKFLSKNFYFIFLIFLRICHSVSSLLRDGGLVHALPKRRGFSDWHWTPSVILSRQTRPPYKALMESAVRSLEVYRQQGCQCSLLLCCVVVVCVAGGSNCPTHTPYIYGGTSRHSNLEAVPIRSIRGSRLEGNTITTPISCCLLIVIKLLP